MIKKLIVISLAFLTAALPPSGKPRLNKPQYSIEITASSFAEPERIHPPYPGYRRELPVEE